MAAFTAPTTLSDRLQTIFKSTQFYWWLGHVSVLLGAITYFTSFGYFTLGYKLAYLGAMASYGSVVYLSHQPFTLSMAYAAKLFGDENFSYLFIAMYWFTQSPLFASLIPFILYSVPHFLGYLRSNILPLIFPDITKEIADKPASPSFPAKLSLNIAQFSEKYYVTIIRTAVMAEVSVVPVAVLLNVITFQMSFTALFFYGQFLRQRAMFSQQTRLAFSQVEKNLDAYILTPKVPVSIQNAYRTIKGFMASAGQPPVQPQAQ